MKLTTSRFGEIEIADEKIIRFPDGIPGLEELQRYSLIATEETEPFQWFQSLDDKDIALAVIDPTKLFPDYNPNLPDSAFDDLEFGEDLSHLLVLSVAVIPQDFRNMTVNLVSPIVINSQKLLGKQVILENSDYQIRQPIFDLLQEYVIKGGGGDAGSDA